MSGRIRVVVAIMVAIVLLGTVPAAASEQENAAASRYIVALSPGAIDEGLDAQTVAAHDGVVVLSDFSALHEFSTELDPTQYAAMTTDSNVRSIMPDLTVHLASVDSDLAMERVQADNVTLPEGVGSPSDINVAVLDTGIDPNQPALNVVGGYSCISGGASEYGDVNGHGTHVAGIIGATDTGSGIHGVAPGARLWAIKVFDDDGLASLDHFLCGANWVAEHADTIQVVNFSAIFIGNNSGGCGVSTAGLLLDPVHLAVCQIVDQLGIPIVAAAGNFGSMSSMQLPAAYPEAISVGAIVDTDGLPGGLGPQTQYGLDDQRASFSNYGPTVTLFAPGVDIVSTRPLSGYVSMSGTSMAAPIVTGAVVLYLLAHPDATPAQIKNALIASGDPGDWAPQPLLDIPRLLATDPSVELPSSNLVGPSDPFATSSVSISLR
jgi:subtilisin